jgi:protein-S-isoprenylcysteine O-methyltransferase Ste14/membrane-associated phospholipid phosphatase
MTRLKPPQIMYGAVFVVLVPLALTIWAHETSTIVHLPSLHSSAAGAGLVSIGTLAILAGMFDLWRYGGGLPMNAFPPPQLVEKGAYKLVPHPIYGGFVLACAGVAVWAGSASGFWLVMPCVALCCAALVLGYELPDLQKRFGTAARSCWLPMDTDVRPTLLERLRVYLVVLLPWLVIYELMGAMGRPINAVSTYMPFELHWPVIKQAEVVYASTYLVVALVPLLVLTGRGLRRFALYGLRAMALNFPLYLLLPIFVPPRPCDPNGWLGWWMTWERGPYAGCAAFPSFHVAWALIAASTLSGRRRWTKLLWWTWAVLVALSCIATGMHSIADVIAGAIIYITVIRFGDIWKALLRIAERIANSWDEWRFGPVRVINHGGYNAAAAFVGMSMIGSLLGPSFAIVTASIFLCSIVGAVMWAQFIEGSPALLRPMGFYGGFLGAVIGALPALFLGVGLWTVLAAICMAAPWIQALGRLRCLVQGCCHGRPSEAGNGIRYTHPRTRVYRLAHLSGVPIYATQLYSILWNILVGLALLRLFSVGVSGTIVCGIYLILSSAGRFVEEAYRGEPQTKTFAGLHIYKWIAATCLLAGIIITAIETRAPLPTPASHWSPLLLGAACGMAAWFVSGVDFPDSSRRFARLT